MIECDHVWGVIDKTYQEVEGDLEEVYGYFLARFMKNS